MLNSYNINFENSDGGLVGIEVEVDGCKYDAVKQARVNLKECIGEAANEYDVVDVTIGKTECMTLEDNESDWINIIGENNE